ncbi:unnamed protein product [Durusdinium trenchii]|uniref:EF-hand domain-containing protein n=1 Tax=Durusdinium trenchii TaxID=1381693 RepID=A0ABP0QZ36_9DINO
MGCGGSVAKAAAVETDVNQVAEKSEELEEEVQDGLQFVQVFDAEKTGFLPRETIATILQLCSSLSEEEVQERMKDLPSNSQGLEYHHIIPFIELEATYDLEDPKHLAKYLLDAGVRLIRAPYLYKLLSANRCMPRRQEAEHDCCEVNGMEVSALISHEEVAEWAVGRRKALICSVSHAWETREHRIPATINWRIS